MSFMEGGEKRGRGGATNLVVIRRVISQKIETNSKNKKEMSKLGKLGKTKKDE